MASLYCKNHPDLRWYCKDQAISLSQDKTEGYYNGARNIFFFGQATENKPEGETTIDNRYVPECPCKAGDLRVTEKDLPRVIQWIAEDEKR